MLRHRCLATALLIAALVLAAVLPAQAAWEPSKPIEFIIPGGAGAEGFLHVKGKKGDTHTIIITLSNLFTTPLAQATPFNWKELTPVARLALDQFILWVNAETPYKTAREYMAAVKGKQCKEREKGECLMGGTGSKQEDQIITVQLEQALGVKFTYVPFKGGGEVCVNLVGKHVDSTVNNPVECASHWKAGRVRPLAVFDTERIPVAEWKDIPTVKEALGTEITYLMLRGIFGTPDMPKEAVDWYQGFLKKVYETPEFKDYLNQGALKPSWLTGAEYVKWLEAAELQHKDLMVKGGLLKK